MVAVASKIKWAVDFEFSLACIFVPKLIAIRTCGSRAPSTLTVPMNILWKIRTQADWMLLNKDQDLLETASSCQYYVCLFYLFCFPIFKNGIFFSLICKPHLWELGSVSGQMCWFLLGGRWEELLRTDCLTGCAPIWQIWWAVGNSQKESDVFHLPTFFLCNEAFHLIIGMSFFF